MILNSDCPGSRKPSRLTARFVSASLARTADNEHEVSGDLTIRGVTRPVKLGVLYNGTVKGFDGNVAAFEPSACSGNWFP